MRRKSKLLAAIGVPLLTLLLTLVAAPPLAAQQLPNVGFKEWKTTCGKTDAYGADNSKKQFTFDENERPGVEPAEWNGSSVHQTVDIVVSKITKKEELIFNLGDGIAELKNVFVGQGSIGSQAPGFLTLGTPWVYAVSDVSSCDGGVYGGVNFTYRPDAISVKAKRTDSNDEKSHIILYSWRGNYVSTFLNKQLGTVWSKKTVTKDETNVDRAVLGKTASKSSGTLIASVDYAFSSTGGDWQTIIAPITYTEAGKGANVKPEMMNVIISAGEYWDRGALKEGTTLDVTDVKLIYYSRLASVEVGGQSIEFADGVYEGTFNGYRHEIEKIDLDAVKASAVKLGGGQSATVNASFNDNSQIVITVTGVEADEDGQTSHTYTINYKPYVCSHLDGVKINGVECTANEDGTFSYNGVVGKIANLETDVVCTLKQPSESVTTEVKINTADNSQLKITVTGNDGALDEDGANSHSYTVQGLKQSCSRLTGDITIGAKKVALTEGVYAYDFPGYLADIIDENGDFHDIDFTLVNEDEATKVTPLLNEAENKFIITVTGQYEDEDGEKEHVYTFTYKPYVCSRLASITLGDNTLNLTKVEFKDGKYTGQFEGYLDQLDIDKIKGSCKLIDETSNATIAVTKDSKNHALIVTVTGENNSLDTDLKSSHIYTFSCTPNVCSRLQSVTIGNDTYRFTGDTSPNGIFEYNYDGWLKDIHLDEVEASYTLINGNEATKVTVEKNLIDNQLEITVSGHDECGHEEHRYIIHCKVYIALESIAFDKESYELTVGETLKLTKENLTLSPEKPSEPEVHFSWVDEPDYATETPNADYTELTLIGKKPGKFTVTATSVADPKITKTVEVTVKAKLIRPTGIKEYEMPAYLYLGESNRDEIAIEYTRAEGEENEAINVPVTLTWKSNNEDVITVDNGKLTLTDNIDREEKVTITATATFTGADGKEQSVSRSWMFTVLQPIKLLEWVNASGEEVDHVNIKADQTPVFKAIFAPENAIDTNISYKVVPATEGGEIILSYNEETGEVTATGLGTNRIIAHVNNYVDRDPTRSPFEAELEVNVIEADKPIVYPTAITGEAPLKILYACETKPFDIRIGYAGDVEGEPVTADISTRWESSKPAILTVLNNRVTLASNITKVEPVSVTVTATYKDANGDTKTLTKSWEFEVRIPVKSIAWQNAGGNTISELNIKDNESPAVKAVLTPAATTDNTLTYTVDGPVKYVDGKIVPTGAGTATITASVENYSNEDGSDREPIEAILTVNVEGLVRPTDVVEGNELPKALYIGQTQPFTIERNYIPDTEGEEVNVKLTEVWENGSPDVVSVVNGRISLRSNAIVPESGKATVKLKTSFLQLDGTTKTIEKSWEFVVRRPVTSVLWQDADGEDITSITIEEGNEAEVKAVIRPATATDKVLMYDVVSEPGKDPVVAYENGKIVTKGQGTNTIIARSLNFSDEDDTRSVVEGQLTVTVVAPKPVVVAPKSIELADGFELPEILYIGETDNFQIPLNYVPEIDGKEVNVSISESWTSTNTGVVKVSKGLLTISDQLKEAADKVTVTVRSTFSDANGLTKRLEKSWEFVVRQPVTGIEWRDANGNSLTTVNLENEETMEGVIAVALPATATDPTIEYEVVPESGKEPVVSYVNGKLTAIGQGTSTIIARSLNFSNEPNSNRKPIETILTVNVAAPKPVTVRPKDIVLSSEASLPEILYMGETKDFEIPIEYVPETEGQTVNAAITEAWSSSNEEVVAVKDGKLAVGKVLTKAAENVKVTVTATFLDAEGKSKSIEKEWIFKVRQPVTGIEWQTENGKVVKAISLAENTSINLSAIIKPATATESELEYVVKPGKEKAEVVMYENGVLSALGRGTATLVARAKNFSDEDKSRQPFEGDELAVTVSAMKRTIIITEADGNDTFLAGKSYKLSAEIIPAYEEPVELTWSSSDPEVATISADGTLEALAAGVTTITVADPDGNSASLEIEVQGFPALNLEIPGYLTVTAPDGTVATTASSVVLTTTTWNTLNLTVDGVSISGFDLGEVKLDSVGYTYNEALIDGAMHPTYVNILAATGHSRQEVSGVAVEMSISTHGESFVDVLDNPAISEIYFNIALLQMAVDYTAVFTTRMPEGFDDVAGPKAGAVVNYPGSLTLNVVATASRSGEAETFVVDTDLKVTYLTDPDADGWFTADIEVPALHFGAIDEENLAPGEEPDYRYNLASFVMDNVAALRKGNIITYQFEETEVETDGDGYYTAAATGKVRDTGSAEFTLTINDNHGVEVTGSFSNEGAEGELYKGYLSIEMAGSPLADNMPASVVIIPNEDGETVTFILPNFTLEGIGNLGDIKVENVNVTTDASGTKTYDGFVKDMQLLGGAIVADVTMQGTIDAEGYADMTINVVWNNIPINVKFTGELSGTTTGIEAPAADEAEIDGPVEYFTLGGVRVANSERLAPGFYIERRGNKARKILVR